MVNKNIIKARIKLDKLDDKFLSILKKRTSIVQTVLDNKRFKKEIIDRKRINLILKRIKIKSIKKKIDPEITRAIWKAMINAYIKYEFRKFKK